MPGIEARAPERTETPSPQNAIDRYFKITERGSTIGTEIRGGLVTFFTMAYIIVLNPIILGGTDGTGADLAPKATIAATTALVAGVLTILMGLVANFPLALAAGLCARDGTGRQRTAGVRPRGLRRSGWRSLRRTNRCTHSGCTGGIVHRPRYRGAGDEVRGGVRSTSAAGGDGA